jgi:hypothetical protein
MEWGIMKRTALSLVLCAAFAGMIVGCDHGVEPAAMAAESIDESQAIVEQHDDYSISWLVEPSGRLGAMVRTEGGAIVDDGVSGKLVVRPLSGAGQKSDHLLEPRGGVLRADIGKLEADLTEVGYSLDVNGKKVEGVLHVPAGGTPELIQSAKAALDAKVAADAKGPHGGLVQVVGDDTVEIVAHKESGELRVYILDADLKPVLVGDRKVQVALVGESSQLIRLEPRPDKHYFVAKVRGAVEPVKVTVVIHEHDHVHVALCGYHHGHVVHVGHHHHRPVAIFVVADWHDHDHWEHDHWGHHDKVDVKIKMKHKHKKHGHGGGHVHVKIH